MVSKFIREHGQSLMGNACANCVCGGRKNANDSYAKPTVATTSADDILMGDEMFGPKYIGGRAQPAMGYSGH